MAIDHIEGEIVGDGALREPYRATMVQIMLNEKFPRPQVEAYLQACSEWALVASSASTMGSAKKDRDKLKRLAQAAQALQQALENCPPSSLEWWGTFAALGATGDPAAETSFGPAGREAVALLLDQNHEPPAPLGEPKIYRHQGGQEELYWEIPPQEPSARPRTSFATRVHALSGALASSAAQAAARVHVATKAVGTDQGAQMVRFFVEEFERQFCALPPSGAKSWFLSFLEEASKATGLPCSEDAFNSAIASRRQGQG